MANDASRLARPHSSAASCPILAGPAGVDPDELEPGPLDDGSQGVATDVPVENCTTRNVTARFR